MGILSTLNSTSASQTPTSVAQNTVSPYAQGYVGNMLSQGQALANAPMPTYNGQLTAGTSNLQNQAWNGLANLTLPSDLTNAGQELGQTANQAANVGSTFTPTNFTNTYTSPGAYQGQTATNQYTGTGPYQGMQASTQNFDANAANQYMNPYLSASLAPQLQLLQQQLGQQNAQTNAQLTQAGAYGGGRQAVANSQNALNSNLAADQLISQGYNTAYNNAQQAFTSDQARQLQAQQANIGQQQFGANQALSNAQNTANYGQQAQGQNIQQQQFGATQAQTEAQQQSQALQAQQAAQEAAKQFGSNLSLQGLQAATTAQQAQANAGTNEAQYGLQNLNALSTAGTTQQAQNQAALTAQYNQYLNQLNYPQQMLKLQSSLLSGLPIGTTNTYGAAPSALQNLLGTTGGVATLQKNLQAAGLSPSDISSYIKNIVNTGGITNRPVNDNTNYASVNSPVPGVTTPDGGQVLNDGAGGFIDEFGNPVDANGNPI